MSDPIYLTSFDIQLLRDVFEEVCAKNKTAPGSPAAENLAKALTAAFEHGMRDRASLLQALEGRQAA